MSDKFSGVLLLVIFTAIPHIVLLQKYSRNLRGRSSRSDPAILKVYPSADLRPKNTYTEDAGVPPNAGIPPIVGSEDSSYDNKDYENKDEAVVPSIEGTEEGEKDKVYPDESIVSIMFVFVLYFLTLNGFKGANGCICVPYYQCDDGNIISDGSGIIDPRKIKPTAKEIPLVF